MSDAELLVSEGERSENGEYIMRRLPTWMSDNPDKGNFKLLDVVGRAIDRIDGDINDIDNASSVQNAETVSQLEKHSALVELPPKRDESIEKYRSRVIAEFQTMTTEATVQDIIRNTATILDINQQNIDYTEPGEHGVISLGVPNDSLESLALTSDEFIDIIAKHTAAGFSIQITISGTFTYISPETYQNGDFQLERGYDGLDSEGNQKGNGGTYSGIIN